MSNKVLAFCAALAFTAQFGLVEAKKGKLSYLLNLQHEIVEELDHAPLAHHAEELAAARHHERDLEAWSGHEAGSHTHQIDMHAERHSWAGVACPAGEVKIGCCKCVAANSEEAPEESEEDKPEPPSAPEEPSAEEPPSEEETPEPPSADEKSDEEDAIHFVDHNLRHYESVPHQSERHHRTQHHDFDAHHIAREHH